MDAGGPKGKAKSDINVTPLIDIVLVLLIVFIVMVPGLTKGQNVVPPQVVEHPPEVKPEDKPKDIAVVVSIDKDGKFYLQTEKVELADLKGRLVDVVKLQPLTDRKVILKVDEEVQFQQAVQALDAIKQAGDECKKMARDNPAYQGVEGSDIRVPITIKKRS